MCGGSLPEKEKPPEVARKVPPIHVRPFVKMLPLLPPNSTYDRDVGRLSITYVVELSHWDNGLDKNIGIAMSGSRTKQTITVPEGRHQGGQTQLPSKQRRPQPETKQWKY